MNAYAYSSSAPLIIVQDTKGYLSIHETDADARPSDLIASVFRDEFANLLAAAPDLLDLVHQYANDMRYPPADDSRERRLEAINAVLAKIGGEA